MEKDVGNRMLVLSIFLVQELYLLCDFVHCGINLPIKLG